MPEDTAEAALVCTTLRHRLRHGRVTLCVGPRQGSMEWRDKYIMWDGAEKMTVLFGLIEA